MSEYYMGVDPGTDRQQDGSALVLVRDGKFISVNPIPPGISQEERSRRMDDFVKRFAPPMRMPSDAAIAAEADALDRITLFLDLTENRPGRTFAQISAGTGLAIGRVQEVCKKSEIILKQRPRNRTLWFNDWDECEPEFRPKRKRGPKPKAKTA